MKKRVKYKQRAADAAYLKAAYLGAFAKFGYRWILTATLERVRQQIREPTESHIPVFRTYADRGDLPILAMFLVGRPIRCLLAKIRSSLVFLPWLKGEGEQIYEWLDSQKKAGRSITCSFSSGWEWPMTLELSIDQVPPNEP